MATITTQSDSATIGTTEHFLYSDSTTATYQTIDRVVEVYIDLSNMAAGDEYIVRLYEKVNGGTARVVFAWTRVGQQDQLLVIPARLLTEGWEVSVAKVAGADRPIAWSFRMVATS